MTKDIVTALDTKTKEQVIGLELFVGANDVEEKLNALIGSRRVKSVKNLTVNLALDETTHDEADGDFIW
jgi:hypothetical protein